MIFWYHANNNLFFTITGSDNNPTKIENIVIEVESGSFGTNKGARGLTSSILYGITSSLLSYQTESLITNIIDNPQDIYL